MKFKEGVQRANLQIEMRPVLTTADEIWRNHGRELVITSVQDGNHSPGSLHYYGYAVDLRTRYWERDEARQVYYELKEALKSMPEYDVVWHESHNHVEYDIFKI